MDNDSASPETPVASKMDSTTKLGAICGLVGTLVGYVAGLVPTLLGHWERTDAASEAARTAQVQSFTQAMQTGGLALSTNPKVAIGYFGTLYALANSAQDADMRIEEKRTVIAFVSEQGGDVQVAMLRVYQDDKDVQGALSEMPAARNSMYTAVAKSERIRQGIPESADATAEPNLIPNVSSSPSIKTGWIYVGRGDFNVDGSVTVLMDGHIKPLVTPAINSQVKVSGNLNLRSAPPSSESSAGRVLGVLPEGSSVTVSGAPVVRKYTNSVGAVWVPVTIGN